MQYFKPEAPEQFVGDCMPFYHDGTFRLYYLIDEEHHQALNGLGGHQWAQASSTDLIHWTHHPLAIPLTEAWEGSICTGTTFYHRGTYYGFYATRRRDRTQHLSLAVSQDGIHFEKVTPELAFPPSGYSPYHFRDPFVFQDEESGRFHILVTAALDPYPIANRGGCLAHLVSQDLQNWEMQEPFLLPGLPGAPECPDYFVWNGWYYLIFSHAGMAHYRLSRRPFGPWIRPTVDTFDGAMANVMKTAAFHGNRRIGAAWIGTREGNKDNGRRQFGGHTVFREVIQHNDGSLGTMFPAEMAPGRDLSAASMEFDVRSVIGNVHSGNQELRLEAREGLAVAALDAVPRNVSIRLTCEPAAESAEFGLRLRASEDFAAGYELCLRPYEQRVTLNDQVIYSVDHLDRRFDLEVVLADEIIDVCIDNRRCIVDRCPEQTGDHLFFFCHNGDIAFRDIQIRPLHSQR
jgi:hypothetical protein